MSALVPLPQPNALITQTDYERMREAVARVAAADEAKAWIDSAATAAFYARQIRDREVETWLMEIKRRAEYRLGEMLLTIEPSRGGRPKTLRSGEASSIRGTVLAAGLDPATATRLMQLAGPRDEDLQAVGRAAAETYYAQARETQHPATRAGLQAHIDAAVHAAMGPDGIRQAAKGLHAETQARKKDRRDAKIVTLTRATATASAQLGARLYNIIYADPPWRFESYSAETGMDRAADNHYPTMTTADIAALPVPAAPCCGLFLWATAPMIFEAGDVLRAWDFAYSTHYVWNKNRIGLGYRVRNKHEILLIGTRGGFPLPPPELVQASVIDAPLGRHSEKPARFAEILEQQYPTLAKVELFARAPRPGWDVWGNEVEAIEPEREAAYA